MKVALFQYDPKWESRDFNMHRLGNLASGMNTHPDLMIFPELTLTGFTMRSKRFAEPLDGPSAGFYRDMAARYNAHLIGGLIEKRNDHYYNSLMHFSPEGKLESVYRKIHPFSYSGENRFYHGGGEPVITRIGPARVGLSVCYDLRFPELFRSYGKAGTEMVINIANWPETRIVHWETLLKARAIENQAYVIGVNRVGSDKKNRYNGCSAVFHPFGEEVLMAENREGVFFADLDLTEVERVRKTYPFLADITLI
jgi:omega-amidase